jgi:hypothetical protein
MSQGTCRFSGCSVPPEAGEFSSRSQFWDLGPAEERLICASSESERALTALSDTCRCHHRVLKKAFLPGNRRFRSEGARVPVRTGA